jgi:hypothetical protein
MKKQTFYSSPAVEVAELFIEKGIAQSAVSDGYGDEGSAGGEVGDGGGIEF